MASLRQLEANRNNAQHSTGPITEAGKAESSNNSFKTGLYAKALIIRGEKQEDFDALTAEYYDRYEPEAPEERDWLDRVIRTARQLRRYDMVEAQLWEHEMSKGTDENAPLGEAFSGADQKFARLQRMVAATPRALREAQQELDLLRAVRQEATPPGNGRPLGHHATRRIRIRPPNRCKINHFPRNRVRSVNPSRTGSWSHTRRISTACAS